MNQVNINLSAIVKLPASSGYPQKLIIDKDGNSKLHHSCIALINNCFPVFDSLIGNILMGNRTDEFQTIFCFPYGRAKPIGPFFKFGNPPAIDIIYSCIKS